jgi:hypothetical protein
VGQAAIVGAVVHNENLLPIHGKDALGSEQKIINYLNQLPGQGRISCLRR